MDRYTQTYMYSQLHTRTNMKCSCKHMQLLETQRYKITFIHIQTHWMCLRSHRLTQKGKSFANINTHSVFVHLRLWMMNNCTEINMTVQPFITDLTFLYKYHISVYTQKDQVINSVKLIFHSMWKTYLKFPH